MSFSLEKTWQQNARDFIRQKEKSKNSSCLMLVIVSIIFVNSCTSEPSGKAISPSPAINDKRAKMVNPQPPPPAPFMGPSRSETIRLIKSGNSQKITLGRYEPQAFIEFEHDKWVLRELIDGEEDNTVSGFFMPEHTWQFKRPGQILLQARSKRDFIEELKKFSAKFWQE